MKKSNTKKLALAGVLCAVAVVGSMFSFPVFGSKCAPVQHMVNVLCAVLLGPWYGVGAAFVASLLRNLLGLGSLMAFPGSMCGALLCGIVYHKTHKLLPTLIGEVFGTGIIGAIVSYPVMTYLVGRTGLTWFFYVPSFISGTLIGGSLAFVFLRALAKNGQLARFQTALGSVSYAVSSDVWSNAVGIAALGLIGYLASVVLLKMLLKLSGTWVTVVPYALVGAALLAAVIYLIRNRSQLRQQA